LVAKKMGGGKRILCGQVVGIILWYFSFWGDRCCGEKSKNNTSRNRLFLQLSFGFCSTE